MVVYQNDYETGSPTDTENIVKATKDVIKETVGKEDFIPNVEVESTSDPEVSFTTVTKTSAGKWLLDQIQSMLVYQESHLKIGLAKLKMFTQDCDLLIN